jgi:hypothetical protein
MDDLPKRTSIYVVLHLLPTAARALFEVAPAKCASFRPGRSFSPNCTGGEHTDFGVQYWPIFGQHTPRGVSSTLAKYVIFGGVSSLLRILYQESHSALILPVFGMRPPVGLLDEFLSKKRSKPRVKFYAKPSGYDVVVADTR